MIKENLDFILDVMNKKLEQLLNIMVATDQKIGIAIGFVAAMVGAVSAFLNDSLGANIFTFGVILLFCSLLFLFWAIHPKQIKYPPHEDQLYTNENLNGDVNHLKNQVIADLKAGYKDNLDIQEKKATRFSAAMALVVFGLGFILFYFIYPKV